MWWTDTPLSARFYAVTFGTGEKLHLLAVNLRTTYVEAGKIDEVSDIVVPYLPPYPSVDEIEVYRLTVYALDKRFKLKVMSPDLILKQVEDNYIDKDSLRFTVVGQVEEDWL
jgi:phosphatidylethanolamine-binding protein (PEBP) family uncharacterized protein